MKTAFVLLLAVAVLIAALQLYVRFAPTDAAQWHQPPDTPEPGAGDWPGIGSHMAARFLPGSPEEVLGRVQEIASTTPRTRLLAGSPGEGLMTFETRSGFWGFPDYTTVAASSAPEGTRLTMYARLRFGTSDMGVNRARITSWLSALGA